MPRPQPHGRHRSVKSYRGRYQPPPGKAVSTVNANAEYVVRPMPKQQATASPQQPRHERALEIAGAGKRALDLGDDRAEVGEAFDKATLEVEGREDHRERPHVA